MVASFGQMNGGRSPGGAPLCHGFGVPWLGGREFRAALTALVAAAAVLMAAFGPARAVANGRPNVLVVLTDDQRLDGTMAVMPKTLQWFEDGGTRFNNAFATTPTCCPSRASLFSGRYVHNHGVTTNDNATVLDQRFTIQAYLKAVGYRTGIFGKYFNAWNVFRSPPWFDDWAVFSAGYSPFRVNERGTIKTITQYATSYIRDNAVSFIEASENQDATPWFLEVTTTAPHAPFTPDTLYENASVSPYVPNPAVSETDKRDKPPHIEARTIALATVEATRADQLRTLMSVDDTVQTLFETLEATGETSNTLAFFVADNGYMWGEHGIMGKGTAYDDSVRVPMYARWPGHFTPGANDNRMVGILDLAPTIADAVGGIAPGVPMDGRSMLDPLQNRTRMLTEYEGQQTDFEPGWAALRTLTSLYIEHYADADRQRIVHREYYDLFADPFELDNLLGDASAANDPNTAVLSAQLAADRECVGADCP
jgi:arylsulfatase A-like enzyme